MNETGLIRQFIFKHNLYSNGTVIDVGAFNGGTCRNFAENDWDVFAFEPNPERYQYIEDYIDKNPNKKLTLEKLAVNDADDQELNFYLSDVSKGISSLTPFHNSHELAPFKVNTIRLDTYINQKGINHVNFLKIDTEGHDYFVLMGFPWDKIKPDIIECEFEDLKSKEKLNYVWKDMAEFLVKQGYHIIISEWYPIVRYGITHNWRCFKKYPCVLDDENAWGNFICFQNKDHYDKFIMENKC